MQANLGCSNDTTIILAKNDLNDKFYHDIVNKKLSRVGIKLLKIIKIPFYSMIQQNSDLFIYYKNRIFPDLCNTVMTTNRILTNEKNKSRYLVSLKKKMLKSLCYVVTCDSFFNTFSLYFFV
jgi:hypothetical protein